MSGVLALRVTGDAIGGSVSGVLATDTAGNSVLVLLVNDCGSIVDGEFELVAVLELGMFSDTRLVSAGDRGRRSGVDCGDVEGDGVDTECEAVASVPRASSGAPILEYGVDGGEQRSTSSSLSFVLTRVMSLRRALTPCWASGVGIAMFWDAK